MRTSSLRAMGYALASFTAWVLADTCMKLAGDASLPPYETIGLYGFFGAGFLLVRALAQGRAAQLRPKNPRAQLVRATLALVSNLANAVALKHLPLTTFYVAVFCAPMVITIGAAVILRERLTLPRALAVAAGFTGVLIGLGPETSGRESQWIGYAAAFITVASYSASTLWLRIMTQEEMTDSVAFFAACVEMVFGAAVVLFAGFTPLSWTLLLILAAMGLLGTIGTVLNILALKYTTAANVSQFHYTQIIAGAALGYLIWHEIPGPNLWAGAAIISAAGLFIAAQARRDEARSRGPAPAGMRPRRRAWRPQARP